MSVKKFNTRIQLKNDTSANWTTSGSLVLLKGEFAWDSTNQNFKIGTGSAAFSVLDYAIPAFGNTFTSSKTSGLTTYNVKVDDSSIKIDTSTGALYAVAAATPGKLTIGTMEYNGAADKTITLGNGLVFYPASGATNTIAINLVPETNGYITVGANGINVTNIDSNYTTGNTTNLATVATVTAALNTLSGSATIASESNGVVTLKAGVSETNGVISNSSGSDITLAKVATTGAAEDVSYNNTNSNLTATTVQAAIDELDTTVDGINTTIENLDATNVQAITSSADSDGDITVTLNGITQTNGLISQGNGTNTFVVGNANLKVTDGTNDASVFTANAATDATLTLGNGLVFDKTTKTISVNANDTVSDSNKVATMNDIATLTGAMHYKGAMASDSDWPQTTVAGDVYVVTTGFTHSGTTLETGDMVVFSNDQGAFNVVQTNMTLGVDSGQVAPNTAALTSGNIVVATANGISTSSYTPANIASQAITVSTTSGVTTVSDTLTVGGTAQAAQTFTLTGSNGISTSSSGSAITITADVDGTYSSSNKIATQSTVTTAIAALDADLDASGTAQHGGTFVVSGVTEVDGVLTAVDSVEVEAAGAAATVKSEVIGQSGDAASANTIYGAKAYADAAVSTAVDGLDVTEFALAEKNSSTNVVTIHGISETDGEIAVGVNTANDVTLAPVAATGAAEDVSITDTNNAYSSTNVDGALDEIAAWELILDCGSATQVVHTQS